MNLGGFDDWGRRTVPLVRTVSDGRTVYTTHDGVWRIVKEGSHWLIRTDGKHPVDDFRYKTLRDARHMLFRRLSRYTYEVHLGEACVICGRVRDDGDPFGFWWHSACRGKHDNAGRNLYLQSTTTPERNTP